MAILENLVVAVYAAITLIVALAAWRAWSYARSTKVLLLAAAFTVLLVKAVFLAAGLFIEPEWEALFVPSLILDLIAVLLIYLAVLRPAA
jgi:hypothetical protein